MENRLEQGERLDDLMINHLKIIQNEKEFCFSLDAVLLAHFAFVRQGASVVDLGSGTGVIGFLLTARGAGQVVGIEISPAMAQMAERSVSLNGLTESMSIIAGDFRRIDKLLPGGTTELVVSNPPYRVLGGGFINPNDNVARARHEITANLDDVIAAAKYLVKYRGRFAIVHLPERMTEILKKMSDAGIEPKRLRLVYPYLSQKPNILLVEGIRGAKPGLDVLPPLIVYNPDGSYCEEIREYYKGEK
jgi:tRNA1(Val) A37 N6-methylase TrmN6